MPATTKKLNKEVPFEADPLIWNSTISIQPLVTPLYIAVAFESTVPFRFGMSYSIAI